MPLEFALRPRIKLVEGFAPARRSRWRVPRLALPIAAYWLSAGGITYALIRAHDQPEAVTPSVAVAAPAQRPWWREPAALSTSSGFEAAPVNPVRATPDPEPSSTSERALAASEAEVDAPRLDAPLMEREDPGTSRVLPALRRSREVSDDAVESASREAPVLAAPPSLVPALQATHDAPLLGATPPDAPVSVANALPSCESAAAAANQEMDLAQPERGPDLSRESIASVLDNGVWIARCDIPMTMSIDLCVAIRAGKAIGVSVVSRPASAGINACVKRRAASLSFPYSARVDVAKTRF